MGEKYTLRDLIVYLVTGFAFAASIFCIEQKEFSKWIIANQTILKDNSSVVIALSLPLLYLLGHIVQAVDMVRYKFAKKVLKPFASKKGFFNRIIRGTYFIIAGDRIEGVLHFKNESESDFWNRAYKNILQNSFGNSEYWYLVKDLSNNLETIFIVLSLFCLFNYPIKYSCIFLALAAIFWVKSRAYTSLFVQSVNSINAIIKEKELP